MIAVCGPSEDRHVSPGEGTRGSQQSRNSSSQIDFDISLSGRRAWGDVHCSREMSDACDEKHVNLRTEGKKRAVVSLLSCSYHARRFSDREHVPGLPACPRARHWGVLTVGMSHLHWKGYNCTGSVTRVSRHGTLQRGRAESDGKRTYRSTELEADRRKAAREIPLFFLLLQVSRHLKRQANTRPRAQARVLPTTCTSWVPAPPSKRRE